MVAVIEGVAAEASGTLRLTLSADHPADHRIGDRGILVKAHTVDDLVEAHGGLTVSLIKVDVQGAEVRVLRGALRTIRRFRPVLLIEIDDSALSAAGFSADVLLDELESEGYKFYEPHRPEQALTRAEAIERRRSLGYADFLCRA